MLSGKKILIGIGGGIAAYKVCEVISTLFQLGGEIRVILTSSAQSFITPLTVATLSRHQAYTDTDFWQPLYPRPLHIALGEWAEVILIAPLTANTLAKLNYGLADNLLTNTLLASTCPVLLAPAMNTEMWEQASVQRNWQEIQTWSRYHTVGPEAGLLACDRVGKGRMAEPQAIVNALQSLVYTRGRQDLQGKRILITAGGTREHLDPVRFLGNPSSGKMGIALAQACHSRGAQVTLVYAPLSTSLQNQLPPITTVPVTSAKEMYHTVMDIFPLQDWLIMSAAVADVQPSSYSPQKLPKQSLPESLPLQAVPDILMGIAKIKQPHQLVIGFAAQTGDILPPAQAKLKRKQLDAIVANPIDAPQAGFNSDTNQAIFLDKQGRIQEIPSCTKLELAHRLIDYLLSK